MSHQSRGEHQIHTSHLVPSMGPIVLVVTLYGQQTSPRKADQST